MPRREISAGPLRLGLDATRDGAGVRLGLGGQLWRQAYGAVTAFQLRRRDGQAASAGDPSPAADAARAPTPAEAVAGLRARVDAIGWYHTIDLGHGIRTPGVMDHLPHLARYGLPDSLAGQRVLDIGTFDGFWAFEFERRGAAEVVALDLPQFGDLDFPPAVRATMAPEVLATKPGAGFILAQEVLGSRVERRLGTVYTMGPESWGRFDLTHMGNVLVHLRDPALALQRMAAVTRGTAVVVEEVDPDLPEEWQPPVMRYLGGTQDCNWWRFSAAALVALMRDAGFANPRVVGRYPMRARGSARDLRQVVIHAGREG